MKARLKSESPEYDIIVATPGRLIDLMERKVARLDTVADVVMDEADEMYSRLSDF